MLSAAKNPRVAHCGFFAALSMTGPTLAMNVRQVQKARPVPRVSGVLASRAIGRFHRPVARGPGTQPQHTMGDTQAAWARQWRRELWTRFPTMARPVPACLDP